MSHVVVTGSAGFIGAHLCALLRTRGHAVLGIDRRPGAPGDLIAELTDTSPTTNDALRSAEAVFHLAGCPGVRSDDPDIAARRLRDNVIAGRAVLEATPLAVPLVVISSSSVYGGAASRRGRPRPCVESDPLRPRGGYARSKLTLERLCAQRAARGGHVAVARPFTVAGENQRPDMAIARWLDAVQHGRPVQVLGSLDRVRDITDVHDVAEGVYRLADREVTGAVNLGTGRAHSLREVLCAVEAATGTSSEVVVEPVSREEPPATLADTRRCATLLGFEPRTDLPALVRRQLHASIHIPLTVLENSV